MNKRGMIVIALAALIESAGMTAYAAPSVPTSVEIPSNTADVCMSFKPGAEPGSMTLSFKDAPKVVLNFKVMSSKIKINMAEKGPKKIEEVALEDNYIAVSGLRPGWKISCYSRPNMERYTKDSQLAYIKKWESLPPASEHFLNVELRLDEPGFEIWIDGRYCGRFDGAHPSAVNIELGKGGVINNLLCSDVRENEKYLPLDVSQIGSAHLSNAKLPFNEGRTDIDGVPMIVSAAKAGDVGAVRGIPGYSEGTESNFYLARSPLDGMPETFHFSVPANQYAYAHVLCMVENEQEKVPELTARITRLVYGRGISSDAIMDSHISFPGAGEKLPPGVKQLGDISYEKDGKAIKSPLYLVSLPLKTGAISDLVFQPHPSPMLGKEPYLDFEVVGRTMLPRYADHAPYPNNDIKSSVKVLGLTLERSPVEIELKQDQLGNVFFNDEVPAIAVELRGLRKTDCTLEWDIADSDGKSAAAGSREFKLDKGGKESFRIPMDKLAAGWYAVNVKLKEGKKELINIPVAAAILGKDTRKAGKESPYASRTSSIMQPPTAEIHGVLMQKAGIRHITPMGASLLNAGEKVYSQWNVSGYQIPWMNSKLEDDKAAEAEIEKKIRDYLEKYPSANSALIFHESLGGQFPPELLDEPTPSTVKREDLCFKYALRVCKVYREKFPNIRLQLGNSGNSLYPIASMMRLKFPKEYIDAMGEESLGQAKMPENPHYEYGNGTALNFWLMKQLALKMGYGDLPVNPCSEWKGRQSTDLGDLTKAEWDMRDLLISYAFGCKTIRTPDLTDQGSAWYDNEYGSQGAMRRYPLLYPKPSYVATATMTKVLDCVEYIRQVPMESNSTYVLELKRYGKEYVYAFWLPRGAAELNFDFGKDMEVQQFGMLGKETVMKTTVGALTVNASSGPCYLVSPDVVKNVFRTKEIPDPIPADYFVASSMGKASGWKASPKDTKLDIKRSPVNFYGIKGGDFELSEVNDSEKGACLKYELKLSDADPATRAGTIRLNAPTVVPGKPNTIGVWVKGNSSWARLDFEFEDAEGEIWRSCGADWPANLSVNFDGWHFVRFPINDSAGWPHQIYPNWIERCWGQGLCLLASGGEPNPNAITDNYWADAGKTGNKKIDYPIKLTGINVLMPRKVLDLTEMKDVNNPSLCFKNFGAYSDTGPEGK